MCIVKRTKIDFDWKFLQDNVVGAEKINFNDSNWQKIDIPHDWSIDGPINKLNSFSTDYQSEHQKDLKPERTGFFPVGIGWYRKYFNLSENNNDKKIFIEFPDFRVAL